MMHKGYMTVDGRVVRKHTDPDAIGEITYHEQRFNLRRTYVHRWWRITLGTGDRFEGDTRAAAIDKAMTALAGP